MALKDDLVAKINEYVTTTWPEIPNGTVVPEPESLTFSNTGIHIDACAMYADIHGSTTMVDTVAKTRSAEYYKSFLHCSNKIIRENDGTVTAYDGDRIMAIFMGDDQAYRAVKAAFEINYAVQFIINPAFDGFYKQKAWTLQHTVGMDCGQLLATKVGVRDDRDIVWVGPAANYAAKLNSFDGLNPAFPTRISKAVHAKLPPGAFYRLPGQGPAGEAPVWDGAYCNVNKLNHYRSNLLLPF